MTVRSLSRETAPGPSGFDGGLVHILKYNEVFLDFLCDLCKRFANGSLCLQRLFTASRLVPLLKNNSGDIRPIAVGEVLYRICSTVLVRVVSFTLLSFQFGVRTPGGVESIIYLVALKARNRSIVSVDIQNAYNSIRRDFILEAVIKREPALLRAFTWSYGNHSSLFTLDAEEVILASGVKQGDPLSPLLFSLGYSQILSKLSKKLEDNGYQEDFHGVAYLDDTYFFPKPDHATRLLKLVESLFTTYLSTQALNKSLRRRGIGLYFLSVTAGIAFGSSQRKSYKFLRSLSRFLPLPCTTEKVL